VCVSLLIVMDKAVANVEINQDIILIQIRNDMLMPNLSRRRLEANIAVILHVNIWEL